MMKMEKVALVAGTISIWAMMVLTVESLTLGARPAAPVPQTRQFNWDLDNKNTYTALLTDLREAVQGGPTCHDIPMMVSKPKNDVVYFIVNIKKGSNTIRVALRATDIYVLGYADTYGQKKDQRAFFFSDVSDKDAFNQKGVEVGVNTLPYSSSYPDLEKPINAGSRKNLDLTAAAIRGLIGEIYGREIADLKKNPLKQQQAQFLLTVTQMISEAVRFRYIGNVVVNNYGKVCKDKECKVDGKMVTLEGNWEKISKAVVLKADEFGDFNPPVEFSNDQGSTLTYANAEKVGKDVALLKYVVEKCKKKLTLENVMTSGDWPQPLLLAQA